MRGNTIKIITLNVLFYIGMLALSSTGYAQKKTPVLIFNPVSNQRVTKTAKNRINQYFRALLEIDRSLELRQVTGVALNAPVPVKKETPKAVINPRITRAEKLIERGKKLISKKRYEEAVRSLYQGVKLMERNLADLEDFDVFVQAKVLLSVAFAMADYRDEAGATIRLVLTVRPGIFLDKGQYPPRFVKFFTRIKNRFRKIIAGDVIIRTRVADAKIFCDGKLSGTGSATIRGLQRGRHYIRIVADGYRHKSFRIYTPAAGKKKKVFASMKPIKGKNKALRRHGTATAMAGYVPALLELVRKGKYNTRFKTISKDLTRYYKTPFLVTGYITKADQTFHLAIFVYRAKDRRVFQLDPVLIEDDMSNLQIAVLNLESSLSKFISGRETGQLVTRKPAIYAIAPPPPKPAPVVAATKPRPEPAVTVVPTQPVVIPTPKPVQTAPYVQITELPAGFPMAGAEGPAIKPWYKKWWIWTIVGVAIVGAGVGTYFGVSSSHSSSGFSTNVNWTPY